jgi:FkbM family methyltransferase
MNRTSAAFLKPEFSGEKESLEWVLKKLNSKNRLVVFDCGGNFGDYADLVLLVGNKSKAKIELHIFEPSQLCFDTLHEKFGRNKDIRIHKLAVSDNNGLVDLYYPWMGSTGASLSKDVSIIQRTGEYESKSEQVNLTTLDQFCQEYTIEHIDYLKLDIEGYEFFALKGASEMISKRKISYIQVEIGAASIVTKSMLFDIWSMLASDYNFYLVLNHGLIIINEYKADLECFHGASNFILELK